MALLFFISKSPGGYVIYHQNAWVLEIQNFTPAYIKDGPLGPPLVVLSFLLLKNKYLSLVNTSYLLTTPDWTTWCLSGHLW